jgi:hypothetical protein
MRTILLLTLVSSSAFAQVLEADSVKRYSGPDGQLVEVVRLKPLSAQKALIRITGASSPADGLVLPVELNGPSYTARIRGSDWNLLRLEDGSGTVYAPDTKEFRVKYTAGKSDAAELISAHQAQRTSGAIALLAKKEFPFLVKKYEGKAATAVAELNRTCGATLAFTFTWATFSDDDMSNLDVWSLCAPIVTALKNTCAVTKGVTTLACQRGAKAAIERSPERITFTTAAQPATNVPTLLK